jgi:hypothetical protein
LKGTLVVLVVENLLALREAEAVKDPIWLSNIVEMKPGLARVSLPLVMGERSLSECLNVVSWAKMVRHSRGQAH